MTLVDNYVMLDADDDIITYFKGFVITSLILLTISLTTQDNNYTIYMMIEL